MMPPFGGWWLPPRAKRRPAGFMPSGQGKAFVTVGISHLTTSRRVGVRADEIAPGRFRLDGAMPWVTAAEPAGLFVTGAVLDDRRQMFIALPADRPGVSVRPPFLLAALQASCTAEVVLNGVHVDVSDLLAGPAADLSSQPGAVGTAGLETSALALGQAARHWGDRQAGPGRSELTEPVELLCENWRSSWQSLMALARGAPDAGSASQLRTQANALVLRATQAYLTARRAPVSSGPSPPSAGRARPCFSWSGRARRRSPRPRSATWRACAGREHYRANSHSDRTYSMLPSLAQPSSWAASLSCWPRLRSTARKEQFKSGSELRSPQSFSNWATG